MTIQTIIRASTVAETIQLLGDVTTRSHLISGGWSVTNQVRNGRLDCDRLVDISRVEAIQQVEEVQIAGRAYLKVGAGLSFTQVAQHPQIRECFPDFAAMLLESGDPARRNSYTLGGRLAIKRSPGMFLPALAVLEAVLAVRDQAGETLWSIMDWYQDNTNLPGYLITAVLLPLSGPQTWVVKEVKRRQAPGELIVGVIASALAEGVSSNSDRKFQDLRIACQIDSAGVRRLASVETALQDQPVSEALLSQALVDIDHQLQAEMGDDADAQYRRRVLAALVGRCLNQI
jgi:CO/xanthine dehydrogenase FAD-binding subunit